MRYRESPDEMQIIQRCFIDSVKKVTYFSITRLFRENTKDLKNTWEGILKNIFK